MLRTAVSCSLVLACLVAPARAGDEPTPQVNAEERLTSLRAPAGPAEPARLGSPMSREILTLLDAEQARLPQLYEEFATASTEAAALAAQKKIETLKRDTEIGVLRIQLRYAKEAGRHDTITRLEESLHAMNAEPESTN